MASNMPSSSNNRTFDPTALPSRWLDCPRKSNIIDGKFIAFKTPLDDRYKEKIPPHQRWNCNMLMNSFKDQHKTLGLVIDLTNTDRFYNSKTEFVEKNVNYEKIRCRGHGETPNDEQIAHFISTCTDFFNHHPDKIIGVHCTHGFNRTGFLICSYLCSEQDMSLDAAIKKFAEARPTGIYKQDYINELVRRYGDESEPMSAPSRPEWCETNSDDEDEPNERPVGGVKRPRSQNQNPFDHGNKRPRQETQNPNPQFAVSLPGVTTVCLQSTKTAAQLKCQRMCEWNGKGFPGSQPVSMDQTNYMIIFQSSYMVSWKADGTRYMMLIEDENKIYMFDRDHSVFEISHLRFPKDSDNTRHLTNTLVDGELVIDNDNGRKVPRFLIYDIVIYENENVGKKPFPQRLEMIMNKIILPRNEAAVKGRIDKSQEPFSVRNKGFWDLPNVPKLLAPRFRSQIAHEVDGLIFQPVQDPYVPGRCDRVLKWKEDNTIDFLLRISVDKTKIGCLPEKKALLFVNGMSLPFAEMIFKPELRRYDNKIIECSFRNGQWHFLRERTDKSFPNYKDTAFGAVTATKQQVTAKMLCDMIEEHMKNHQQ